ncbi:MAG: hypothetical protein AVDCRST_MAG50-2312, partial [uncultured Acidimicrobiales bacterium]
AWTIRSRRCRVGTRRCRRHDAVREGGTRVHPPAELVRARPHAAHPAGPTARVARSASGGEPRHALGHRRGAGRAPGPLGRIRPARSRSLVGPHGGAALHRPDTGERHGDGGAALDLAAERAHRRRGGQGRLLLRHRCRGRAAHRTGDHGEGPHQPL